MTGGAALGGRGAAGLAFGPAGVLLRPGLESLKGRREFGVNFQRHRKPTYGIPVRPTPDRAAFRPCVQARRGCFNEMSLGTYRLEAIFSNRVGDLNIGIRLKLASLIVARPTLAQGHAGHADVQKIIAREDEVRTGLAWKVQQTIQSHARQLANLVQREHRHPVAEMVGRHVLPLVLKRSTLTLPIAFLQATLRQVHDLLAQGPHIFACGAINRGAYIFGHPHTDNHGSLHTSSLARYPTGSAHHCYLCSLVVYCRRSYSCNNWEART